jgi:TusA-related sulfurtransferase
MASERIDQAPPAAQAFLDALARQDFEALEATLDPSVQFRALSPGENITATAASEAVACYRRWFGDKTDIDLLDRNATLLVDRVRIEFTARVRKNSQPYRIAQTLCGDLEGDHFVMLDVLCSGFRPEPSVATRDTTHVFDAGDLGCGTGLPREFRTRLSQIPIGHVIEVITGDPSAREDIPSLARLLGHQVRSVESGADGRMRIQVERLR